MSAGGGFFHCSVKSVGRTAGRSVVAAAAYRSGERLEDQRSGEVFDYRGRRASVLETFILLPGAAPSWAADRAKLWNGAERAETRSNARLATEVEIALPHELSRKMRKALATEFGRGIAERYGVAVDVALHAPGKGGDHRNYHAHVLVTHRKLDEDGFIQKAKGQKKDPGRSEFADGSKAVIEIRQEWEQLVNQAYERAGLVVRVDHRSHKDRGIEQEPTTHLGPKASEIERSGGKSERGNLNREIEERNASRGLLAELEQELAAVYLEIEAEVERQAGIDGQRDGRDAPAPIFDRDQANRDWDERLVEAAIAADRTAAQDRGRPEEGGLEPPDFDRDDPFAGLGTPVTQEEAEEKLAEIRARHELEPDEFDRDDPFAGIGTPVTGDEAEAKLAEIRERYGDELEPPDFDRDDPFAGLGTPVTQEEAEEKLAEIHARHELEPDGFNRDDPFAGIGTPVTEEEAEAKLAEIRERHAAEPDKGDQAAEVFGLSASWTIAPAPPIFDRDAANREWEENLVEAAIARDTTGKGTQERQEQGQPEREGVTPEEVGAAPNGLSKTPAERFTWSKGEEQQSGDGERSKRAPWMTQSEGYAALGWRQRRAAKASYADWAERSPEAAKRHTLESYVSFVQGQWARDGRTAGSSFTHESPSLVGKTARGIERESQKSIGVGLRASFRLLGNFLKGIETALEMFDGGDPVLTPADAKRTEQATKEKTVEIIVENLAAEREALRDRLLTQISRDVAEQRLRRTRGEEHSHDIGPERELRR